MSEAEVQPLNRDLAFCNFYFCCWLLNSSSVSYVCVQSQQTTTRDFTCSVNEFTSSTGSIHVFPYVNSPDSVNKFGVSTRVYREITSFQWNRTSSDPVRLVSNSFITPRDNRQNTCIHVNTQENMYWWNGTNYEPVWHVPTGSEMVPCLLGYQVFLVPHCSYYHTSESWQNSNPDIYSGIRYSDRTTL